MSESLFPAPNIASTRVNATSWPGPVPPPAPPIHATLDPQSVSPFLPNLPSCAAPHPALPTRFPNHARPLFRPTRGDAMASGRGCCTGCDGVGQWVARAGGFGMAGGPLGRRRRGYCGRPGRKAPAAARAGLPGRCPIHPILSERGGQRACRGAGMVAHRCAAASPPRGLKRSCSLPSVDGPARVVAIWQ
jgi:hypothetical protein